MRKAKNDRDGRVNPNQKKQVVAHRYISYHRTMQTLIQALDLFLE